MSKNGKPQLANAGISIEARQSNDHRKIVAELRAVVDRINGIAPMDAQTYDAQWTAEENRQIEKDRIERLLSRSKLAKEAINVIVEGGEDGDACLDAAICVLGAFLEVAPGIESPPRMKFHKMIKRGVFTHLAEHARFRRMVANGWKQVSPDPGKF